MSDIKLESTTCADGTTIGYLRQRRPRSVITHGSVATCEQWIPAQSPRPGAIGVGAPLLGTRHRRIRPGSAWPPNRGVTAA